MAALIASLLLAAPAAAKDWSTSVAQLPSGAYVLGNPMAKVKLVEYLSLTCSHCAEFSAEAWPALKADYVRTGQVSLEVRHAVRDGFDLSASLLARCEGPRRYFPAVEDYFARQRDWLPQAASAQVDTTGLAPGEVMAKLAEAGGLDRIAAAHGLAPARISACLAAAPDRDRLTAMAREAWQDRKIGGTPAFLINGQLAGDAHSWALLEPQVQAALR